MKPRYCFNTRGFTLIELLIVIAIILILIAIALPNFLEAQIRARVTKSKSEIRTIKTALESYFIDWEIYPRDHDSAWPYYSADQNGFQMLTTPLTYLKELPEDPFGTYTTGSEGVPGVPRNRSFHYEGGSGSDNPACGGRFLPYSSGGAPSPPNPAMAKKCVQAYLVIGIGPDQDDSSNGNDDFPIDSNQPSGAPPIISFTSYAPTNGTKSRGDIYDFAGQIRQGYFYLDGQIIGYPR